MIKNQKKTCNVRFAEETRAESVCEAALQPPGELPTSQTTNPPSFNGNIQYFPIWRPNLLKYMHYIMYMEFIVEYTT